jgi:hypothetical protein
MTGRFAEILILIPTALEAGFLLAVSGVIQKVMNDSEELKKERRKLQTANDVHAWLTLACVVLMVIGFA